MSILDRFNKFKKQLKGRSEQRIDLAKELALKGHDTKKIMREILRPTNFYECLGGLSTSTRNILPILLDQIRENRNSHGFEKHVWEQYKNNQEYCDEFFGSTSARVWVTIKVWNEELGEIADCSRKVDALLGFMKINAEQYRENEWWKVACYWHIANKGHEEKEDFRRCWDQMTMNDCLEIIRSLSEDDIAHYRCIDT